MDYTSLFRTYYVELNFTCIAVLLLILIRMISQSTGVHDGFRYFRYELASGILFCVSDMGAALVRGATFAGARILVYGFNMLYMEAGCLLGYFWFRFSVTKLSLHDEHKRFLWVLVHVPILLMTILIITDPLTGYIFSIDADNLYKRGPFVFIHWIVCWGYMIVPTVQALSYAIKEKRKTKRVSAITMVLFIIAPFFANVVQILFYGTTTIQVGYTISGLTMFLRMQYELISRDGLTELNNRGAFDKYLDEKLDPDESRTICLILADIDGFKHINDVYGHIEGDRALKIVAKAIKETCDRFSERLFAARYGGDEFAIVVTGASNPESMAFRIKTIFNEELERCISNSDVPYPLKLSIGHACGSVEKFAGAAALIKAADEEMYLNKAESKGSMLS